MTAASSYLVYVGTYTGPKSKGIYGFRFDPKTGQLTSTGLVAEMANPSWVVTDPQHRFLYAATEMGPSRERTATRRTAPSAASPSTPRPARSHSSTRSMRAEAAHATWW